MAESTIFDCLNAINEKRPGYSYSKKTASAYMLMMWLSHSEGCISYIDKLNERLFDMPDELVFAALYKGIPKGKRFIKWDKGIKDKGLTKKKEDIIKSLMEDHGFSKFEAGTVYKRYIDI